MNTYIKHSEDDSLTHYGVKGMKWKKRKAKALDIAWEIAHPVRGGDHVTEYNGDYRIVTNEGRRKKTKKEYELKDGKWKKTYGATTDKKTGKKKLDKATQKKKDAARRKKAEKKVREAIDDFKYGKTYDFPKKMYSKKTHKQTSVRGTKPKKVTSYESHTRLKGIDIYDPNRFQKRFEAMVNEKDRPKKYRRNKRTIKY